VQGRRGSARARGGGGVGGWVGGWVGGVVLGERLRIAVTPRWPYFPLVTFRSYIALWASRAIDAYETTRPLRARGANVTFGARNEFTRNSLWAFRSRGASGTVDAVAAVASRGAGGAGGASSADWTLGARDDLKIGAAVAYSIHDALG
jgi:hypothetical protein